MKRKAIIFPYNAECASLVRNRELLLNHEIVACVSPIGYGLQGKDAAYAYGGENTGIVISDKKISEINFDDLLVCESSSDFDTFIMPQVKLAAECGKNVIFLYNISQQQKKEAEETCKKKNVKCVVLTNRRMDTDKLGLRKFLQEEGYKVSQIGTKEYCELFGFHAIPEFMYANQLSEADKIVWFNRICKSIELQEKPDIFIIGVPGATMVFNETITNNFGITAFEIANAVRPDTAIMCVPYEGYDSGFLKMIQTSSKYKLDMQVDCFNMANKHFDVARSKEEKKLSFITTGADLVDKRIEDLKRDTEIPIYNSLNVTSALEMYSYIVNKLSESDFGTVS